MRADKARDKASDKDWEIPLNPVPFELVTNGTGFRALLDAEAGVSPVPGLAGRQLHITSPRGILT